MFSATEGDSLRAAFCTALNLPSSSFSATPNFITCQPSYFAAICTHFAVLHPDLPAPLKLSLVPTETPCHYTLSSPLPHAPFHPLVMLRGVSPRTNGGHVIAATMLQLTPTKVHIVPFHDPHPDGSFLLEPCIWMIVFPDLGSPDADAKSPSTKSPAAPARKYSWTAAGPPAEFDVTKSPSAQPAPSPANPPEDVELSALSLTSPPTPLIPLYSPFPSPAALRLALSSLPDYESCVDDYVSMLTYLQIAATLIIATHGATSDPPQEAAATSPKKSKGEKKKISVPRANLLSHLLTLPPPPLRTLPLLAALSPAITPTTASPPISTITMSSLLSTITAPTPPASKPKSKSSYLKIAAYGTLATASIFLTAGLTLPLITAASASLISSLSILTGSSLIIATSSAISTLLLSAGGAPMLASIVVTVVGGTIAAKKITTRYLGVEATVYRWDGDCGRCRELQAEASEAAVDEGKEGAAAPPDAVIQCGYCKLKASLNVTPPKTDALARSLSIKYFVHGYYTDIDDVYKDFGVDYHSGFDAESIEDTQICLWAEKVLARYYAEVNPMKLEDAGYAEKISVDWFGRYEELFAHLTELYNKHPLHTALSATSTPVDLPPVTLAWLARFDLTPTTSVSTPSHVTNTLTYSQTEIEEFSKHSNSMTNEMLKEITTATTKEVLKHTIASTVFAAITLPLFVSNRISSIDESWALIIDRSDGVGRSLARHLVGGEGGPRVVDLVGISFGARLVYSCLKELIFMWRFMQEEGLGLGEEVAGSDGEKAVVLKHPCDVVGDVVLFGTPTHLDKGVWEDIRLLVGRKVVNCYSDKDRLLSGIFNYKRLQGAIKYRGLVVGVKKVGVEGVVDVNCSELVERHEDWGKKYLEITKTLVS